VEFDPPLSSYHVVTLSLILGSSGERYVPTRRTEGTNVAMNKPYTASRAPSGFHDSAPASNTTILTDGIVGGPVTGSNYYGVKGWGWSDNGYGLDVRGPTVYFESSGPQRLRIQVREDGLGINQIVLSAVVYGSLSPGATKNDTVIVPR
jgi:hypothetical protein